MKKHRADIIMDEILKCQETIEECQDKIAELYEELEDIRTIGFKYKNKDKTTEGSKYLRDENKSH
jgi:uncharacterized coiled-coil DUF342 family protein